MPFPFDGSNVMWTRSQNYDVIGLVGAIKQIINRVQIALPELVLLFYLMSEEKSGNGPAGQFWVGCWMPN